MIKYGYLIGDVDNSDKLIVPKELNKIHLTSTRSKFIVIGTKNSIFEWMKNYGDVSCEFDQEYPHISRLKPSRLKPSHLKPSHKHTTKNHFKISLMNPSKILNFELYDEQNHDSIIKRLFLSGTCKMKLEIKVNYKNKHSKHPPGYLKASSAMSARGNSGIKLQEVLMALKNSSKSRRYYNLSSDQLARVTCDYE